VKAILPLLACSLLLSGCQSTAKKHRELVNQGIAQIDESLKKGRVDLAQKYSSTLRAANPSKTVIAVKEFDSGSKKYVVLPVDYDGKPLLTLDSPEYKEVLDQNKELKEQVAQEVEQFQKYEKKTAEVLIKANEELEGEKRSSFWGWFLALGSVGGIAGLIALCVFFPAAQPLIVNVLQGLISGINSFIKMIANLFKSND
jgi:hypothetical protein